MPSPEILMPLHLRKVQIIIVERYITHLINTEDAKLLLLDAILQHYVTFSKGKGLHGCVGSNTLYDQRCLVLVIKHRHE